MIDFELLKKLDMEVMNVTPTPEENRRVSEYLKILRTKEARNKKAQEARTARRTTKPVAA